jgi:hypothetical protein
MNGTTQQLLAPANGLGTFEALKGTWPGEVDACAPSKLAATSATSGLVVDSTSPFLVLSTTDGGHRFVDVGLPRFPSPLK